MPRMKANRLPNMLAFNGSSDFMTLPIVPAVTGFNIAFWIIKRKYTSFDRIVDCIDSGALTNGFDLELTSANKVQFLSKNVSSTTSTLSGVRNNPGELVHVVVTHNGTEVKIYENGVLSGTDTSAVFTITPGNAISVGMRNGGGNPGSFKMGELIFHSTATPWTQAQITDLYYNGNIPSGASYWLFNGDVLDGSGNGNNGTLTGGTYVYQNASRMKIRDEDACLSFINNNYVQITNPGINITEFSVSFNAKTVWSNQNAGYNDWFSILGSGGGVMAIETAGPSAKPAFYRITGFSGAGEISAASNGTETAGFGWKKFHLVASKTGNYVRLYLNGALIGSSTWNPSSEAITLLRIGTRANLTSRGITAKMNRVRIYSQPLTAAEITDEVYSDTVNTSKLVGQYLLNEGTGSVATDTSGNGNNGTITGATWKTGGPIKLRSAASNRIPITIPRTSV